MVLADASIVAEVAPSAPGAPALTPEAYAETRTESVTAPPATAEQGCSILST